MTEASVEARLLKALVQTVLDEDFTPKEARDAAKALRDNKIFAPVAHLLDVLGASTPASEIVVPTPSKRPGPIDKKFSNDIARSVDVVFDIVKRRKITKAQLFDMFHAVNGNAASDLQDHLSIRESLSHFKFHATDDDWKTLISIIEGKVELDPFLRGMLSR